MSSVYFVSLAPLAPVFDCWLAVVELFIALAIAVYSIAFSVWIIYELKKGGSSDV